MTFEEMKIAYDKPPAEAVEYFKSLGIQPATGWDALLETAAADAFTVAGVNSLDMLAETQNLISQAIAEGMDFKELQTKLQERLELRTWHANLVATQNISNAYNAGRFERQLKSIKTLTCARFVLGGKEKHTPGCLWLAMNRVCVRLSDPRLGEVYPPRHFRCGTGVYTCTEEWAIENGYRIMRVADIPAEYLNQPGFRNLPNVPMSEQLDLSKYPPSLVKQFKDSAK